MIDDRRGIDAGPTADVLTRRAVEAAFGERLSGDFDQLRAPLRDCGA